jgi:hypothetical protein
LTSALVGGEWLASCPGRFAPGERAPGTGWMYDLVSIVCRYRPNDWGSNPGIISQKMILFITTVVETSNPTNIVVD